jgi:hypothetical protein
MKKIIYIILIFLSSNTLGFSQDSKEEIVPANIFRADIFRSFNQLHLEYERFNGKKGAVKAGISIYHINDFISTEMGYKFGAFKGFGFDIQRKFYFRSGKNGLYASPVFIYAYKECSNKFFYEGGGGSGGTSSSFAIYSRRNEQRNVFSLLATFGYSPIFRKKNIFSFDVNVGVGASLIDGNRTVLYQKYSTTTSGHFTEYSPKVLIGIAIGFGIKEKPKNTSAPN